MQRTKTRKPKFRAEKPTFGKVTEITPSHAVTYEMKALPVKRIVFSEKRPVNLNARAEYFMDLYRRGKQIPPILVHKLPNGKYEVVDGHARLEAYRRLRVTKIAVVENSVSDILKKIGAGGAKLVGKAARGVRKYTPIVAREVAKGAVATGYAIRGGIEEARITGRAERIRKLRQLAYSRDRYIRRAAKKKLLEMGEFEED